MSAEDERFMAAAIALGDRHVGLTGSNPSVGALVVRHGEVMGAGATQPGGAVHAEAVALARAGEAARGATLYVTLEPCAYRSRGGTPCADLTRAAGVARVVVALADPNPAIDGRSVERLAAEGLAVTCGPGAQEAARSLAGHLTWVRLGRPHMTVKQALSADGRIAAAGKRPVAITGPAANAQVHMMRARSDAILIAAGTARADDPMLTCRLPGLGARSPIRVVLDRDLSLSPESRLARTAREVPVWVIAKPGAPATRQAALERVGVVVLRADGVEDALRVLGARGVRRVLVEAGGGLSRTLLDADLADRYEIFRAPTIIGADGIPAMRGGDLESALETDRYRLHCFRRHGADGRWTYERRRAIHPES